MVKTMLGFMIIFFSLVAAAADIQVTDQQTRLEYIRKAIVWQQPAWINERGEFAPWFDVAGGPRARGNMQLLEADDVYCQASAADVSREAYDGTGLTPKLYCQLMRRNSRGGFDLVTKPSGSREKIKVKYDGRNRDGSVKLNSEIHGETLGTRLLWALGFGADQMYYIPRLHCFGCSEDPFRPRSLDASTMQVPRVFTPGAVEQKLKGDEIVYSGPQPEHSHPPRSHSPRPPKIPNQGWSLDELKNQVSPDRAVRAQQRIERDAFRLLMVFMHHVDNKADNQRILCLDGADSSGQCSGRVLLFVHDIGTGFGVSLKNFNYDNVNLETWRNEQIWSAPSRCNASTGFLLDGSPRISEEGRQFLVKLLDGFSKGPEGRARVEALFRESGVERKGHPISAWVEVFLDRVQQIKYPMGAGRPNFRCP